MSSDFKNDRQLINLLSDSSPTLHTEENLMKWKKDFGHEAKDHVNQNAEEFYQWCIDTLIRNHDDLESTEIKPFVDQSSGYTMKIERPEALDNYRKDVLKGFKKRINLIKSLMDEIDKQNPEITVKIQWLGKKKELAELFVQLKRKGWIEDIEVSTVKAAFTGTLSIHQNFYPLTEKQEIDGKTVYVDTYGKIFTPKYKAKFFAIPENPRRDKPANKKIKK